MQTMHPHATKFARIAMPHARVLIVDDVQTNLDAARGILKPYGMQVDCVTSGIEAIERMRNSTVRYDAIFMDHMMPEMDGMEATRIIREEIDSDYARNIPIIALTASTAADNAKEFLERGFQAFLSKPINIVEMDFVLRQWVTDKKHEHDSPADSEPARDTQRESAQTGEEETPRIEGIDWQAGLAYFTGNRSTYLSIIRSYIDDTTRLIAKVRDVTEETLDDYAIRVHGIKGSSYGIKAREIGKQAEELEHAAKAGDFPFVSRSTPLFVENLQRLLDALSSLFEADAAKPGRHAPDEALLDQMKEAAANFNIDALEEIMKSLECFKYETQAELPVWLREKVNRMEFSEIYERLAQRKTPEDEK